MKFTPGIAVGAMSGSKGGTTASHNRNGAYFRNRSIPVNPNTPAQTVVRNRVSSLASAWRSLSQGQRDQWSAVAATIPRTDSLGQTYTQTGLQFFTGYNSTLLLLGEATVTDPVPVDTSPNIISAELTVTASDTGGSRLMVVDFGGTVGSSSEKVLVYATAPISQGINFVGPSQFKFVADTPANVTSFSILTTYQALFGPLVAALAGQKVFVKCVPYSVNGYPGSEVRGFGIATSV